MDSISWSREPDPPESPYAGPAPTGYAKPNMTDWVGFHWVCERCGAMVGTKGRPIHDAWHEAR